MPEATPTEAITSTLSPDTHRIPRSVEIIRNCGGQQSLSFDKPVGHLETYAVIDTEYAQFEKEKSLYEQLNEDQQNRLAKGIEAATDGRVISVAITRHKQKRSLTREQINENARIIATVLRTRSCQFILNHPRGRGNEEKLQIAIADDAAYGHNHIQPGVRALYADQQNPYDDYNAFTLQSGRIATVKIELDPGKGPDEITVVALDSVSGKNYDSITKKFSGPLVMGAQYVPIVKALQNMGILTLSGDGRVVSLDDPELELIPYQNPSEAARSQGYKVNSSSHPLRSFLKLLRKK